MELREILAPLFRWWWLIVAAVAVAVVSSLFTGLRQPPIYQSAATVMIGRAIDNPNPDYMQFYASQQLATTYAEIARRDIVRRGAMQALGLDWLPAYTVQPVPNTQLLEISVTDTDPVRAEVVANEVANQLILQSPTSRSEDQERQVFIEKQLDDLEKKIKETQADIDTKQQELTNLTSARQISDLQNQIYTLQTKLDTLRSNYTSLLFNTNQGALNSLTIIEPASVPVNPIGPNVPLMVLTAAALAGVLAVGAAYLLVYLDYTIKSPEEIRKLTNLSMLVGIPFFGGEQYSDKLITVKQPRSPIAEAYRSLRTAVQFSTIDRIGSTAILMTSANPSEGKSITSANLAAVLAQAGHRVLMIDADLRRPVMHRIFGIDNRSGLTEFLRNVKGQDVDESVDQLLPQLVRSTTVDGLWVLTSGPLPPNPSEILGSNSFHRLLITLKSRYDYLIIDSPPVLVVTDAVVLSSQVEGVVIVIDAETTPRNQLKQASEKLNDVNAPLLGVVVNRLSQKTNGFSTYSTYYRKYGDTGYGYGNMEVPPSSNSRGLASSIKSIFKGSTKPKA